MDLCHSVILTHRLEHDWFTSSDVYQMFPMSLDMTMSVLSQSVQLKKNTSLNEYSLCIN